MTEPRRVVAGVGTRPPVPEATVARLPLYLRVLGSLADSGVDMVSSDTLASAAGVTSAKVRKDLSQLGSYGTRGVGYHVDVLVGCIAAELGLTEDRSVLLVGVGNLGHALAAYGGFRSRGFRIVALVDADPRRIGELIEGIAVRPLRDLETVVHENDVSIGVICTPAEAAQNVCDRLVATGVTSILNFAPTVLSVPDGVDVRKVDLAVELQILSFHEARKRAEAERPPRAAVRAPLGSGPPPRAAAAPAPAPVPVPVSAGPGPRATPVNAPAASAASVRASGGGAA